MNLIERLELMASLAFERRYSVAEIYDDGLWVQEEKDREAIETVRAMQEALRSLYARCRNELADPEDVPEMHEAFAALRRAGGES